MRLAVGSRCSPRGGVLGAPMLKSIEAPCVLASERPSHPDDVRTPPNPPSDVSGGFSHLATSLARGANAQGLRGVQPIGLASPKTSEALAVLPCNGSWQHARVQPETLLRDHGGSIASR
jgi:hypothetical protein